MLTTLSEDGAGQLRFSLFGVPVRVDASFAILLLLWALPALGEGIGYAAGLAVIVFASILGHELGHAAAVQALIEPRPSIVIYGLGGLTTHQHAGSRPRSLLVSLAGPAAGLLVGGATLLGGRAVGGQAEDLGELGWGLSVFWTIANLLPVLPLDGGQALRSALPGSEEVRHRTVLVTSVLTCAAGGALAWRWDSPILVAFAAWFGITNLVELRRGARSGAATADELQQLFDGWARLDPSTAPSLEARARHALSHATAASKSFVGSVLVATLLAQDEDAEARDLVPALGPDGCAHALVQLVDLGPDARAVLEDRLASHPSAYDATLLLLDRSLRHDWARATELVASRPPESFEAAWLELATSWAFRAGAFPAAEQLGRVLEALVNNPAASYNVACSAARAGDVGAGLAALHRAADRGWSDLGQLDADDDLAALRAAPEWGSVRQRVQGNATAGGPAGRRWGAAAGLAATLAVAGLSVRLVSIADEPAVDAPIGTRVTTEVLARDPRTGEPLWRLTDSSIVPSWVDEDLVVVEEIDGGTRALDARTGEERWRNDVSGYPTVGDEVVILNETGDEVAAERRDELDIGVTVVDRDTGEVLWSRRDVFAMADAGDVVILAPASRREVVGVDAVTGSRRWSLPGVITRPADDAASTIVVEDAERLSGIDPQSGEARWSSPGEVVGVTSTAAWVRRAGTPGIQRVQLDTGAVTSVDDVADVEVVVGDDAGIAVLSDGARRWGLDERSGEVRWERDIDHPDDIAVMTLGDGLGVTTSSDEVVAVDLRSGAVRWRSKVDGVFYAEVQAGVIVASTDDRSRVLDAATGEELWAFDDEVLTSLGSDDVLVSVRFGV